MTLQTLPKLSDTQNFLRDAHLVTFLLDRSSIGPGDIVLEIGPGQGVITKQLILRCKHLIAVEKDAHLAALLRQKFQRCPEVKVHTADILDYNLPMSPFKVFSNIPFNITSAILTRLTAARVPLVEACLVLQKEAAEMYLGEPHETLRSVLLKPWFEIEIPYRFKRTDFYPAPGVKVVFLRLRKRAPALVKNEDRPLFSDFVVYGYTRWQPTLGRAYEGILTRRQQMRMRSECDLDLNVPPTALPFGGWLKLFAGFKNHCSPAIQNAVLGSERRLMQQQKGLQKVYRRR